MSHYTVFSAIVACLFLPTVGLPAEDATEAGLRERVEVLDQARDKAAAELSAKEQQGNATSRDREHFRKVAEFLDQQIAESCRQLFEKDGTAAVADLPCLNFVGQKETGQEKIEKKSPVEESGAQSSAKLQEKVVEPEEKKEAPSVSVQPAPAPSLEAVPIPEKVEALNPLPQQPPATGFFAVIRRWWESLFAPKLPQATSGSKSGQPAEQVEKTTAEHEDTQHTGDSATQQASKNPAAGNKSTAATVGNREQSDNLTDAEKVASKEKGSGQKQEQQQQENGVKQAVVNGEESGHQAGHEQTAENGDKGVEAAGEKDSKYVETPVAVGSGTIKQKGTQGERHEAAIGKVGAGQRTADREGDTGNEQEAGEEASPSGAGERKTADVDPGGNGQESGQEDGTGLQVSVQPAGQPMAEAGKKRTGDVTSEPAGEKKTTQSQKQGSGSTPVVDEEVAKLEQSLSDALGDFDGKLLSEQERLAARIPKQREGSAGGSGGYGAEGVPGPGGSGGIIPGDGYESSGGRKGDGQAGAGGSGQPGSVAAGRGKPAPADGRTTIDTDDDIVARQLREAAENETDPDLKEKLWQEYRKYKQGGG